MSATVVTVSHTVVTALTTEGNAGSVFLRNKDNTHFVSVGGPNVDAAHGFTLNPQAVLGPIGLDSLGVLYALADTAAVDVEVLYAGAGNVPASLASSLSLTPTGAADIPLTVNASPSQSGHLAEFKDHLGNVITYIDSAGNLQTQSAAGVKLIQHSGDLLAIGGGAGRCELIFDGDDVIALNLVSGVNFVVRDHTGADAFHVESDGTVHIQTGTSVVADL